uniref:Calpain_III domain-containing protein n=1 Tax=Rodentolepis nana TaxID=102285 RepID=A0A0R3TBF1_RODNA
LQVVGASFLILQCCDGGRSSLSIVEDGFVANVTKEQFKAILVHMNSASSMQLRIETTQPLPESLLSLLPGSEHPPTSNNGALITLNWINESVPMHPTSLHYLRRCTPERFPKLARHTFHAPLREHHPNPQPSHHVIGYYRGRVVISLPFTLTDICGYVKLLSSCIGYSCVDGRPIEPGRTFIIPPEHQLRHWLIRHRLSDPEAFNNPSSTPSALPRVAWTRLHSLADRPVYAVDNRWGEVLDCFAVFNAVSSTFINIYAFFQLRLLFR